MWSRVILSIFAAIAMSMAFGDVYIAGDSTVCDYSPRQYPQQGWGQALAEFMEDPSQLHNCAACGKSAKSFKAEGLWQEIVDSIGKGDIVVISFGHHELSRAKKSLYSSPKDFKALLAGFVADVRAKEATPILVTPIPHSGGFSEKDGKVHVRGGAAGLGSYVAKMVELGKELNVPVLNLNKYAEVHIPEYGFGDAMRLYMCIAPGEYKNCPRGKNDGLLLRDTGAFFYAKGVVLMAEKQGLPICKLLKDPKTVEHTPIPWGGPETTTKQAYRYQE